MELEPRTLGDYVAAIKYRKKLVLGLFSAVFAGSAALAFALPSVYRSTATILIEQPEIPVDIVRTTVSNIASERVDMVSRQVMTTENLGALVRKYNLYQKEIAAGGIEAAAARMRSTDIMVEVIDDQVDPRSKTQPSIPFTVSFNSNSPTVAQQVARELADLFMAENVKSRTERAAEISGFLGTEVERLSKEVAEQEALVAAFKEKNAGRLPELGSLNMQVLERTENDLREIDRQLQSAEARRISIKGQVEELEAAGAPVGGNSRIVTPGQRLVEAQTEYYALLAKYSEGHPDVVRARKELEGLRGAAGGTSERGYLEGELSRKRMELVAAQNRYAADHPDVRRLATEIEGIEAQLRALSSSPVVSSLGSYSADSVRSSGAYIQLQTSLKGADAEIASLRAKQGELYAKRSEIEGRLAQAPQVEREYRELSRGYESSLAKLKDVQNKQIEARLAENLETTQKSESFKLITAPALPAAPVSPNRPAILFLGFVFGLAAGIGAMLMADAFDDSVRGSRGVAALLNAPPLAVIPIIDVRGDKRGSSAAAVLALASLMAAGWLAAMAGAVPMASLS